MVDAKPEQTCKGTRCGTSLSTFGGDRFPAPQMIRATIGQAIAAVRDERGLTQAEIARAADLEPAQLSHIVNGHGNPTWGTLVRISAGLGVPLPELLERAQKLG